MSTIGIIVPTLGRPKALAPFFNSLVESCADDVPWWVVFVVDDVDTPTHDALAAIFQPFDVVIENGTYPHKTNVGYQALGDDIDFVLPTADDVLFRPGWYEAAMDAFEPGVDVVGTNDLSGGKLIYRPTMPILRTSYIESPGAAYGEQGTVFHEGFHHNFVDDELWALASHRGVARYCAEAKIEHMHPAWNKRKPDETDAIGNQRQWAEDEALYQRRREMWIANLPRTT